LNSRKHPFQLFAISLGQLKLLADNDRRLPAAGQPALQQIRELVAAFHDLRPRQPAVRFAALAMRAAEHQHREAFDRASPALAMTTFNLYRGLICQRGLCNEKASEQGAGDGSPGRMQHGKAPGVRSDSCRSPLYREFAGSTVPWPNWPRTLKSQD
jgi:hypothetical protein